MFPIQPPFNALFGGRVSVVVPSILACSSPFPSAAKHYDWTQNTYAHVYQNAIAALWSIKQVLEAEAGIELLVGSEVFFCVLKDISCLFLKLLVKVI